MSSITFAGISSARARLARLSAGLHQAASGEVMSRAANKIADQIEAVAKAKTAAHQVTGGASRTVAIAVHGGIITLGSIGYLKFHAWWPFRRGMPPFVVKRASLIFARELLNVLGAAADNTEAADLVSEADAADVAKVEKRAAARTKKLGARRV